jgi:Ca-activated chloride channel family protein
LKEQAPPPEEPKPAENEEPGPAEQAPNAGTPAQSSGTESPPAEATTAPDETQASHKPVAGAQDVPGSELPDEQSTTPPLRPAAGQRNEEEQHQALEQWLRQIPDNPGELLRRKFWYEQQSHQAQGKTQ